MNNLRKTFSPANKSTLFQLSIVKLLQNLLKTLAPGL